MPSRGLRCFTSMFGCLVFCYCLPWCKRRHLTVLSHIQSQRSIILQSVITSHLLQPKTSRLETSIGIFYKLLHCKTRGTLQGTFACHTILECSFPHFTVYTSPPQPPQHYTRQSAKSHIWVVVILSVVAGCPRQSRLSTAH